MRRRNEHGVVIIMSLLAIILLAALLLWVINLGQQVNSRIVTQNAADAAAQAGAGWYARSLNTIAMNNTEMARYIALIGVLDAMPQAVDYANREDHSLRESLQAQLARGIGGGPQALTDLVTGYYEQLYAYITDDIEDITPVDDLMRQFDVSEMTYYANDGHIWRALTALDESNQAIVSNLGQIVQAAAVSGGEVNFGDRVKSHAAFVLPVSPTLPYLRGTFNDFLYPTLQGRLPADIDDEVIRRGPWDTVFGQRDYVPGPPIGGGVSVPGSVNVIGGGRANNPLSRRPSGNGTTVGGGRIAIAYSTFGPYSYMLRDVENYDEGSLKQTRMSYYLNRIADRKFNYVWPGSRPNRTVIDPDWRITYEEAKKIARDGTPRIYETAFFVVEIKSKYPKGDGNFLQPGTWALEMRENEGNNPRVAISRRWQDPASWGIPKLNSHVWRDEWQYTVNWDAEIGIPPEVIGTNPDGTPMYKPQDVYRIDTIAFAGVNVGPSEDVRNPFEGFDPLAAGSPAPMNLRHDLVEHDNLDARWQYLTVLGVARRDDDPMMWRTRFHGGRPYPNLVGIAQAKVFNNHSWDLWTPMWHAELEPVSRYDDWLDTFATAGQMPRDLSSQDLGELQTYMRNARDLAESMMTH